MLGTATPNNTWQTGERVERGKGYLSQKNSKESKKYDILCPTVVLFPIVLQYHTTYTVYITGHVKCVEASTLTLNLTRITFPPPYT